MRTFLIAVIALSSVACRPTGHTADQAAANLDLAKRYFDEVYNEQKMGLIDELFIKDYNHTSTEGRQLNSRDELKETVTRIKSLLPNLRTEVLEAAADEEKAIFLVRMRSDLPAMTNPDSKAEAVDFQETFIFWIRDGQIYKGRTTGAHLPFIKQVSGFEGGVIDLITTLSDCLQPVED